MVLKYSCIYYLKETTIIKKHFIIKNLKLYCVIGFVYFKCYKFPFDLFSYFFNFLYNIELMASIYSLQQSTPGPARAHSR